MSKNLKKKAVTIFVIELLCLVLLGVFLNRMQTSLAVNNQKENTQEKLDTMQDMVDAADATAAENQVSYDELYQAKADVVAYMAQKDQTFSYSNGWMKAQADRMNVTNILVIDQDGNQIANGNKSPADFTKARFNQLRSVFANGTPGDAFNVTFDDQTYRYYAAKIDDTHAAVVENDPAELTELTSSVSSWESILSKINVGLSGFTFSVSSQDYTFLYYPEEEMIGKDSLAAGLETANLEDGNFSWMTINDTRYYCGVKYLDADNAYVICAVPEKEITSSRTITIGIILFIFFMVMTLLVIYALLALEEQEKKHETVDQEYKKVGLLSYNKEVVRRIGALSIIGLLVILIASFYMQTLFSLSRRSMSNNDQIADVEATLEENQAEAKLVTEQYDRRYLNKSEMAAYILTNNPQLWNKDELTTLSNLMNVEYLMIYDKEGKEVISDSSYVNLEISKEKDDPSYDFQKLLLGKDSVVQKAQTDPLSGDYMQFIGTGLQDAKGNANGFVQIALVPDKQEKALKATSLNSVLERVKASAGGFAFSINKEDNTFAYYPTEKMIGKSALENGIEENQIRDQYCDFVTIGGVKYYASSSQIDNTFIYVATPKTRMNKTSLPMALASTGASLICLLFVFWILAFSPEKKKGPELPSAENEGEIGEEKREKAIVDINMPDGTVRKGSSAASRWSNMTVRWADQSPEQQVGNILRGMLSLFAIVICVCVIFKDSIFPEESIFRYILNGSWERSVNIFSVTACLMIICVVNVAVMAVRELLKLLSKSLGARGETVCRLLRNLVKYVSIIALLYYCFALFGVDTATLLASAGILSLVIGLGAKTLVSDILAGLFIIFEGEFQVGDIITIGDWRGTVQEIGIRTTKIVDPGDNVKVISNSAISGVINMTKKNSYCVCDVGIEYGESLERVESILARELPLMKEHIKTIKDGPFYKGVVSLGDNSVNLRIVAQCAESDRAQLGRDLNRAMKLICDKYDINIPFPQVVINQPKEYQQATEWDKMRADAFNEAQKKLSRGIEDGQQEEEEER